MGYFRKIIKNFVLVSAIITTLCLCASADTVISLSLNSYSIREQMPVGSCVGEFSIVYTPSTDLTVPAPALALAPDTQNFVITSKDGKYELDTTAVFDYESLKNVNPDCTYNVTVAVYYDGNTQNKDITIQVTNLDEEAPVASDGTISTNEDVILSSSVSATDTDSVSPMAYTLIKNCTKGALVFNPDGTYTYTPNKDYYGPDSFSFTTNDGTNTSNEAKVSITVDAVNDAPVCTVLPSVTGTFHGLNTLTATTGDWNDTADGGTSTLTCNYQWQTAPTDGGTATDIDSAQGKTYILTAADNNKYIRVKVSCSDTVDPGVAYSPWYHVENSAPVISPGSTATITTNEDTASADLVLSATDGDGDTLSWNITTNGSIGTAVLAGTNVTYTPNLNANGNDSFVVTVSDGFTSSIITVSVTVNPVDDTPSFTKGADQTVLEDCGAKTVTNWATDISKGPSNESTQILTFNVSNDNTALFLVPPSINPGNGDLTYTPALNANGSATVSVSLSDNGTTDNGGDNTSDTQTFIINVTSVNDAPVCTVLPSVTGTFHGLNTLTANSGAWNDTADGGTSTLTCSYQWQTALTDGGTASDIDSAQGNTYTLTATDNNKYIRVKVSCSDAMDSGVAYSPWYHVVNSAPVISPGSTATITTNEDTASADLVLSATDGDGDTLSWNITTNGSIGTAILAGTNVTYTPNLNANGNDSFVVTVSDGITSSIITVSVTVSPVDDVPSFTKGADQTVLEDCGAQTVLTWAKDISKGPVNESTQTLTFNVSNDNTSLFLVQPSIDPTSGDLMYTPASNANGSATVSVSLGDSGTTANGGVNTSEVQTFKINVTAVNDAPTFTAGANQTFAEDCGLKKIEGWATAMSTGPANENTQNLTGFTVTTDKDSLFLVTPFINVSTGDLSFTPAKDANGIATVSVYLIDDGRTDNGGSDTSNVKTFTITITAVNDAPTLDGDTAVTTDEDVPFTYHFTANDVEDLASTLTVSYETDNTALLPKANITLGDNTTDRTLTLKTVANQSGTANITVTVKDSGGLTATKTVTLTVNPVNDAPVISEIADVKMNEDTSSGAIGYAITDVDSDVSACKITVTSDNQSVIADSGITLGGSGSNRTITLMPVENVSGSANITVIVDDNSKTATATAKKTFLATVAAVDDAPTIIGLSDLGIDEEHSTGDLSFTVSDVDDTDLTVTAATDNTSMIPRANIVLGGSGNSRTINITPVTNKFGTANISVTVKDPSGLMSTDTFVLTVRSVNDLPTISTISSQTTNEDNSLTAAFTVSDIETPVGSLQMMLVSSSDPSVIADKQIKDSEDNASGVKFGGSTGSHSVTVTPVGNAHGSSTITIRVTDADGGTADCTFLVTVNSVNDAPTFVKGADVAVDEDYGADTVTGWASSISAGAPDEASAGQTVSFKVTNDNNSLFTVQPAISDTGDLSFSTAANANGYANVSVVAHDSDGADSAAQNFKITLNPVNDAPKANDDTINMNTDEDQSFSGYLTASDVDGDKLKYAISDVPNEGGSVEITNADTGAFKYTPKSNFNGSETFKFKVSDGTAESADATITIFVKSVNHAPVATGFALTLDEGSSAAIDFAHKATDKDKDIVTYSYSDPDHGTISVSADGTTFTYIPDADFYGSDSFTYKAYDSKLYSNTGTVTITVNPVDDAPTAIGETLNLDENQTLSGVLKANDIEHDDLSYTIVSTPVDKSLGNPSGKLTLDDASKDTYTFTPEKNYHGTVIFTFQAKETGSDMLSTDIKTVTINVNPVNNAPDITGTPPLAYETNEDTTLSSNVTASDPDGNALTFTLLSSAIHGTVTMNGTSQVDSTTTNGAFTYVPSKDFNGTDYFTVKASDGKLFTSIVLAKITVKPVNDPPVAYDMSIETAKNKAVSGTLAGYDPDGDALTYSYSDLSGGTLVLNAATGEYTYTPVTDDTNTVTFHYNVSDKDSTSADATVTITISTGSSGGSGGPGDSEPGISDQTTPEDTPITVSTSTSLTGANLTATSSNADLLANSGIAVTKTGAKTFDIALTPNSNCNGRTVITVNVSDGSTSYSKTFVLTVVKVDDAPVSYNKEITIDENKYVYDFVVTTDVDDNSATYSATTETSNGKLDFNSDGTFQYTPTLNYHGDDSFTFTSTDSSGKISNTGTVTIHVRQINRAPVATEDLSFTTDEDTAYLTGQLTATDFNGESLSYSLVSDGSLGTVALKADGSYTYTPKLNLNGSDSFTFKVTGATSKLESNVARVSVTVNPVNDVPTAIIKNVTTNEDQVFSGNLQAVDVEKDPISYFLVSSNTITSSGTKYTAASSIGSVTLDSLTGAYTYTPNLNANGSDSFTFTVSDGHDTSAVYTQTITVTPVDDAPVANNVAINVDEDSSVSGHLSDLYSDVDTGDTQTFSLAQSPAYGTVNFNADGTYKYTPNSNKNGTDYFSFKTTDSGGLSSNVAQVTIVINPINDVPVLTAASTWTINENSSGSTYYFTVSDIEDTAGSLTATGSSSNESIVADSGISFGGSAGNRWMKVTPIAHQYSLGDKPVEITVRVTDSGNDGTLTNDPKYTEQKVILTVTRVNETPTINGESTDGKSLGKAVETDEDTNSAPVSFTVGDDNFSGSTTLTVTGTSDNPSLIQSVNVTKIDDSTYSVYVTPVHDQNGSSRITVSVSDGATTRTAYLDVTVKPVNDRPIVSPPDPQTIDEDNSTDTLYYTISDIDSAVEGITMAASSSDESKVKNGKIKLEGNGAERTVKIVPETNATGDVTITLTANDKGTVDNIGTATFVIHITPVDDAPTINSIPDQETSEDISLNLVPITIGDIDSEAKDLTLKAVSGNTSLILSTTEGINFTGENNTRYINMTPLADANGKALITVTVSDGTDTSSTSFTLTVKPVNDPPKITAIADQTIIEDSSTGIITFNVSDIDNNVTTLSVTGASSDESVIPVSGIAVTGTGGERTLKVTPLPNQNGIITVTMTVKDPDGLTATSQFKVTITPVNDAPSFTSGGDAAAVYEDCGAQSVAWATSVSKGQSNESDQHLTFVVTNVSNSTLFATGGAPAISADGTLTYTPAANANGSSTVTVYLKDDAGTANGGADRTSPVTFTITVNPVNDAPTFTKGADQNVLEDCGAITVTNWATAMSTGPSNENLQTLTGFTVTNTNHDLFSTQPAISSLGVLTYTSAANANGSATVTVTLGDNGGTDHGGIFTSAEQTFVITVNPVNDAPTFSNLGNQTVLEDCGAQTVTGFVSAMSVGPANESGQTLTGFTVTNSNNTLFSVQPAIDIATGKLTYTPAANANTSSGVVTVTVTLNDNGETSNGGVNAATQTFTITITPVNDKPSFAKGANQTVLEDSATKTVTGWATSLNKGASDESGQTFTFTLTTDNNSLFSTLPTVDASGKLTFKPAANANGTANVTVKLNDNGGVLNGGIDTSDTQAFVINVTTVNDAPTITTTGATQNVLEDCVPQSISNWATVTSMGASPDEATQLIDHYTVTYSSGSPIATLFSVAPSIAANGTLTYKPAENANGSTVFSVKATDNGGTANSGIDTSAALTLTINVTAVNDVPSFTKGDDQIVLEDCGAQSLAWTKALSKGPSNESGQALTFTVTTNNDSLFSAVPAIDKEDGKLTYTPALNANGSATVTVILSDDGGKTNGGVDTSAAQTFTITVTPVNDVPVFTNAGAVTVLEDCVPQSISNWATVTSMGASADEATQSIDHYTVTYSSGNSSLFSTAPSIAADGTLTFTPALNANGTATYTVTSTDNGGKANGGVDTSAAQTLTINVTAVNDAPSFTKGDDQTVLEDCGVQSVAWTKALSTGPTDESGQKLSFAVTTNNDSLFSAVPAIDKDGKLTYTPVSNANGSATVTVILSDDSGKANGGADTSAAQTFKITVSPVNDAPVFTNTGDVTVLEDCVPQSVNWATVTSMGASADETTQAIDHYTVTYSSGSPSATLFSVAPSIAANGTLTFTPAANANGTAVFSVTATDNGGTANSGIDTSAAQTLTINVTAVNDVPSFTKGADQTVLEDSAAQTVSGWATAILSGPADEVSQALDFIVTNTNNDLFSIQPAISPTGILTYTLKPNANGDATVSVSLHDNGGTSITGDDDTSDAQTFKITVTPVNDAPVIATTGDTQTVLEDCVPQTVTGWATVTSMGASADESTQAIDHYTITLTSGDSNLFSAGPAVSKDGTLTFTPAANANGTAVFSVTATDKGGTANKGIDTSAAMTLTINVTAVNDAPTIAAISDQSTNEDTDKTGVSITVDDIDSTVSALTLSAVSNNTSLITTSGITFEGSGSARTISMTPVDDANGSALITVTVSDGSLSTSTSFTLTVNPVNDAPVFTNTGDVTVLEDCVPQSVNWATVTSMGASADEATQSIDHYTVTYSSGSPSATLFSVAPSIAANGTLTFTPAANANGTAVFSVTATDNGGTDHSGIDTSAAQTLTINVTAVNDVPSFTKGDDKIVGVNTGVKTYANWATGISSGPANETKQALSFNVTSDKPDLFSTAPSINSSGNLSFSPSAAKSGIATVTVTVSDDGGMAVAGDVDTSAEQTFTITVVPANALQVKGTIFDGTKNPATVISGATVNLLDESGTTVATTTSDDKGNYTFTGLTAAKYIIEVIESGYNNNSRVSDVSFTRIENGKMCEDGIITEDFYMANFVLTLTANPTQILGDGKETAELTATVTDSAGNPIAGVNLDFSASKVNFTATGSTDSKGQVTVTMTSSQLGGPTEQVIPIIVSVNDADKHLFGSAWVKEYFVPGFVSGIVRDGTTNEPIAGATVTVYNDTIPFSCTQITSDKPGHEGEYKIAVPIGDKQYSIKITKPVMVGGTSTPVTFDQFVTVGDITGSGSSSETYKPDISASGVVLLASSDGKDSIVTDLDNSELAVRVVDNKGKIAGTISRNSKTGVFSANGLTEGATYTIQIVHTFDDGRSIVVGTSSITISSSGEMNISEILIDPYGTITDSISKAVISGATVSLYYADTTANSIAGIVPNTLVSLPKVTNFPPAENANSQTSNSSGYYAFLVYPNTDYYIVATNPGYASYTSKTISVGSSIVNWDFTMDQLQPLTTKTGVGAGGGSDSANDLTIGLYSEKMSIEEGTAVKLTAKYENVSNTALSDYKITVTIPDGMVISDAGGGDVSGSKITWSGKNLDPKKLESVSFILKASLLTEKENMLTVVSAITSSQTLVNTSDDTSSIKLQIYSNRFEGERKRYIKGYPEGIFGPARDMTRAETAAIFARLLDLDVTQKTTAYSDLSDDDWAAGYIAAVTNAGMMKGYADGTFGPNNDITRAEFATIIARYFSIERSSSSSSLLDTNFADITLNWAKNTIEEVFRYNIINGYTDGTFKPDSYIQRSEAVTMLNRMLYRGPLSTQKLLYTDVGIADWYYGQVMQASMSFGYNVDSDGSETATKFIDDTLK